MTQSASEIASVALIWRAGVVGTSSSWFGFQFLAEFYVERPSDPAGESHACNHSAMAGCSAWFSRMPFGSELPI